MHGYNLFAYCNNNPVNYVDYTGENAAALPWIAPKALVAFGEALIATVILLGVFVIVVEGTRVVINYAKEKAAEKAKDEKTEPPQSLDENTVPPEIEYPGNDPTVAPDGYEWRGKGEQGSKEGSYYNSDNKSSLHPDLDHPDPIGPHWDYSGPEGKFRIFPDGTIVPK